MFQNLSERICLVAILLWVGLSFPSTMIAQENVYNGWHTIQTDDSESGVSLYLFGG